MLNVASVLISVIQTLKIDAEIAMAFLYIR